ncbi:glycosyltransferase family 2 protein [Streptococcus suis]|nr:glycosyltransferase family 2 protein [Streptococcus suis]
MVHVSVIIPMYNVGEYISTTIDSLLQQSYKNFEIILVNDGSTDDTEEVCRKFVHENNNVFLYNKENGGLSDARNFGVTKSNYDWVLFIDGDDYIESYSIELLTELQKIYDADIVSGKLKSTCEVDLSIKSISQNVASNSALVNKFVALEEMYRNRRTTVSACGKLIKKSIVEKYPFTIGVLYEDLDVIAKYIYEASNIVISDELVYNYYQRPGSIVNSGFNPKQLDFYKAIDSNFQSIKNFYEDNSHLRSLIITKCIDGSWKFVNTIDIDSVDSEVLNVILRRNRSYFWNYILHKNSIKNKVMLTIFNISPKLYYSLRRIKKK